MQVVWALRRYVSQQNWCHVGDDERRARPRWSDATAVRRAVSLTTGFQVRCTCNRFSGNIFASFWPNVQKRFANLWLYTCISKCFSRILPVKLLKPVDFVISSTFRTYAHLWITSATFDERSPIFSRYVQFRRKEAI